MKKTYQIIEYGSFVAEKEIEGFVSLPQDTFNALESFVLSNRSKDTDALELMGLSAKKGIGKVITAKNYVGVISMKDGTTIEILPKVLTKSDEKDSVKKLLIDMLKSLKNTPYKSFQKTNVDIEKMSVFEVFIRMFIDEVLSIEKRGLKSDYQTVQSNETVFKGKLRVSEHIKHNFAHKERIYIEYDEYNINRPENRLIKTTLKFLYRCSHNLRNRADIKNLLNAFSSVDASINIQGDFAKCTSDRNMKDYTTALMWCRVFLLGKSFTSFLGSEVAFALLFPMETLFESYIAQQLKKHLNPAEFSISVQDKRYHLFDEPSRFLMKPDIVVKRKHDDTVFVLDTKWKMLSATKANGGISQADMYQMYAYQKKYNAKTVSLIYPISETMNTDLLFHSNDGVTVRAVFVDLMDISKSISHITENLSIS